MGMSLGVMRMDGRMRWGVIGLALLVLGCSKPEPDGQREEAKVADASAPDVGITRTPGVALSYEYGFRLPIERIAAVQEQHAAQCEALTPARCRITGMNYHGIHRGSVSGDGRATYGGLQRCGNTSK